ncbi:MAG: hypothetical protein A3F16_00080 [Deltaproteobacteria bacterium RIFCSPHIGHO2_12_FULL_43_9]|nr:MAG: hypothetical protein A3F16_00080 [Deltaproteobacteria bacterium RIFCSPHIGHO2_12_FULL_43_9]
MKVQPKKKFEKFAQDAIDDAEQKEWESGRYGRDPKHAKVAKIELPDERPLPTSIRIPVDLIRDLKELADCEGLRYQAYLKMILTRHVRAKKKELK